MKNLPRIIGFLFLIAATNSCFPQTINFTQTGEEFSGPFPSWKNVKTVFGAKGDGVTDDAPAINAAMAALHTPAYASSDSFNVLYFPAGTYLIKDSLYNVQNGYGYDGMAIIGEDPATTIISWGGPSLDNAGSTGAAMFNLCGWYLRISRLTFEGNNNAYRGIVKSGGFSTNNEFSDLVFKDFKTGIGLDFSSTTGPGQAEDAVLRCSFINCSTGVLSCNWNSLDEWIWWCYFQDCNFAINQCTGYFQIYNNVFLRSKITDISGSPYKSAIVNNTSFNSKCFFSGTGAYIRGNKIYSNVDSFYTSSGANTVLLDNLFRVSRDSLATTRTATDNMFIGNTFSMLNSQWSKWPFQPSFDPRDHGLGASAVFNKQIEKAIDGNPATSFETDVSPFGIKWNCPMGTQRAAVKYTVSAPLSSGGTSPLNFQLLGSNNWGYNWEVLDQESGQNYTGGGNPNTYPLKNKTAYSMYELLALDSWLNSVSGGRSIVNSEAQAGTFCEKIVLPAAAFPRNVFQNLTVYPDTSYVASGWMKDSVITTSAYFIILWYNTPVPPVYTTGWPTAFVKADTIGISTGTQGWTFYRKTITAPADALSAQFYLAGTTTASSNGTVWFDSFSFSSSKTPSTNLLNDPGFEQGLNPSAFEVNEFTLLDSTGSDLTKDPNGFVSGADEIWGDFYALDNQVLDTTVIPFPSSVSLPATPQNLNRKIFEVVKGTGNDALEIQSKIDSAALLGLGNKPVVHIPYGQYSIKTTITVPSASDMQIIGDGLGTGTTTSLVWAGNEAGPLFLCQGPSRITLKDFLLQVPYTSYVNTQALVIDNGDQAGGRIYGMHFYAGGPQWTQPCDIGLLINGVENSDVSMFCSFPGFGTTAMVQANGGPVLSSGGTTNGQISWLAGATGSSQNLFNVFNGGRIDAEGMWNEGGIPTRTSGLLNLSNTSGSVSVACMSWNLDITEPMVNTDNFNGNLTLMLNHFNQSPQAFIPLTGNGADLNVLCAYNDWGQSNTIGGTTDSTWQDLTSPAANAAFIDNTGINGFPYEDVVGKVHYVRADSTSLLNSLAQLRAVRTNPPNDMVSGVTDLKLFRVAAWGAQGVGATFNGEGSATGISTVAAKKSGVVSLYPTLVSQNYMVSYSLPQSSTTYVTVFDVYGKQLSETKMDDVSGNHLLSFSATELISGSYYLRVQSGLINETKKFIVIH